VVGSDIAASVEKVARARAAAHDDDDNPSAGVESVNLPGPETFPAEATLI